MTMRTLFSAFIVAPVLALATLGFGTAYGAPGPGPDAQGSQSAPSVGTNAPPAGTYGETAGVNGAAAEQNPILNMKAGEISGREIYNPEGRELGKVDMIARDRNTGELSAIIGVGGFLGFGGTRVAVPIEQLVLHNNKLVLSTAMSKKELRTQARNYRGKHFEAVPDDTTLSQVAPAPSAVSPQAGAGGANGPSFAQLDLNHDGVLSRDEVAKAGLLGQWRDLDRNHDGRIEPGEFAAFEQQKGAKE